MEYLRDNTLAFMLVGLLLPIPIATAQSPTVSIDAEYLATLEANLDPAFQARTTLDS